jgi:hypothetical protein
MIRSGSRSLVLAVATLAACAPRSTRPSDAPADGLVRAYEDAMVAAGTELPTYARTRDDITLFARARELAEACTPGHTHAYSTGWLDRHGDERVHTSEGEQAISALAARCGRMLEELSTRPIEACGARFVQLESHRDDADAWSRPRITHTSEGWYMTPCDRLPGHPPTHDLLSKRDEIRAACDDPAADVLILAHWTDQVGGKARTATAACFESKRERSDWLIGNPALGVK